jgi:hypothetical protein
MLARAQTPNATRTTNAEIRAVRAARAPSIDGRLIEAEWADALTASEFTQRDPDEGLPATERTDVRFLYDNDSIYIGLRLFDRQPREISRRLSTRDDDADADTVTVFLDPMHDHLTGAIFRLSAANVQQDFILHNDSSWDESWDAVWESGVQHDENGWTAEIRIPLSQLRFLPEDRATWGVNIERFIRRNNERVMLQLVPKSESGVASKMGHLVGLDGLRPRGRFELLPYAATRGEFISPQRFGDPFNDGSRTFLAGGLDMKWGVTSNLTLNATANPDFGQVEVDPAVVNLSAFETFFPEKRPFFLEGSQIFDDFGRGGSVSSWGFNTEDPQIFYSRRIGRVPRRRPEAEFFDLPAATTILGAAKVTGKTSGGWSIGVLDAVTERETAKTQTALLSSRVAVEPLANYFVARVQRDLGARAGVGVLTTAVNRRLEGADFEELLAEQAYVAGADAHVFLDSSRDWVIHGKVAGSRVSGATTFVESLQRAPQRYYQRPDAPHIVFDPSRTSLSGYNGRLSLNRNNGVWRVNSSLWAVSPGFESNDVGFHNRGDRAGAHTVFMWRNVTPDRLSRSRTFWAAKAWTWNLNRELQSDGWFGSASFTFLNYWEFGSGLRLLRRTLDDRLTRGGPAVTNPRSVGWDAQLSTDSRKLLSLTLSSNGDESGEAGWSRSYGVEVRFKPSSMLTISTGPELEHSRTSAQYVRTVSDATAAETYGARYIFGDLDRTELSMTTRVGLVLTPRVSLQIFAQPLLSSGDYREFKELARPRTFDFTRFENPLFDPATGTYTIEPGAGASPFSFSDPDFNFKSARLNAVFRWELKPGSTLYAVWTRQQVDLQHPGDFALGRDARAMFGAPGDDVFLVKLAYWIGR